MSWSSRRKGLVISLVVLFIILFFGVPAFIFLYEKPTCFDGKKNQSEQDIDCGGICAKICQTSYMSPEVKWTRYDYIAPGLYSVGAYIANFNLNSEIPKANYIFKIYDKDGIPVTEKTGSLYIPPNRNTLAFEHSIDAGKKIVGKVIFELLPGYEWQKTSGGVPKIEKINEEFISDDSSTVLSVDLENKDTKDYENIKVYAILKNEDGNVIGLAQSIIDSLPRKAVERVTFTWNESKPNITEKEIIIVAK